MVIDALNYMIYTSLQVDLSWDNMYLYWKSHTRPNYSVVAEPGQPPHIAEDINLLVFDLKTMWEVKLVLRNHPRRLHV